ncbi:Brp/Blh family beta-carotene 15,15'-dioxygenase [Methylobacterium sp. NMS12]|uniref:Brp/Blh family beta-carotene 15,15'-dioxygenase n=1 Tax=Methylobacterium sp. NMS12 TaxID=3079766 RepID=UPI003F8829C3
MDGSVRILPPGAAMPLCLAVPILATSLLLPWQGQWFCAAAVTIVLGVPHGALDVEIGRTLLRDRVGWAWFPLFAAPYLTLVAAVLIVWRLAPEATLSAFLAVSVWHFGSEETGDDGLPALAVGGLPVALPVLLQPAATAQVLAAISGVPFGAPPTWLLWGSLVLVLLAAFWCYHTLVDGPRHALILPILQCLGFAFLPPLTAFTLYFVCVHAPMHTAALIRNSTRAPRIRDTASAWWLAIPTTVLTVLIGISLWPLGSGEPAVQVVRVTLQLLAALTLPHLLLDVWLAKREKSGPQVAPIQSSGSVTRKLVLDG